MSDAMTLPARCRSAAENWLNTEREIPTLLRECAEALEAAEGRETNLREALHQCLEEGLFASASISTAYTKARAALEDQQ